jgi:hypothetical protein
VTSWGLRITKYGAPHATGQRTGIHAALPEGHGTIQKRRNGVSRGINSVNISQFLRMGTNMGTNLRVYPPVGLAMGR